MGVYDLGLTSEQFWKLTPAQFFALIDRKTYSMFRQDLRSGIIASTLANVNRGPNTPPYKASQFMAESYEEAESDGEALPPEELLKKFQGIVGG